MEEKKETKKKKKREYKFSVDKYILIDSKLIC